MIRTKTTMTLSLLAAAIIASSAQAAGEPQLLTRIFGEGTSAASFAGGATSDSGTTFTNFVSFGQTAGVRAVITPAAGDVGTEADLYAVANIEGAWYMRTSAGWQVWNTMVADLDPYSTKVLAASEAFTLADLEAALAQNLDGKSVRFHVGYMTDTSPLVYSSAMPFSLGTEASSTTCPTGNAPVAPVVTGGKSLCVLSGTYTQDLHLTPNFEYVVSGPVFFGVDNSQNMSVTFDAGVKTYGESGADFMRVSRGSKIHINGTAQNPVILTGAAEATATVDTTGLWGGLVVNGNARVNGCTEGTALCERTAEGNAGTYGGTNDEESSGNINYLVLKYAGFEISPGNELNGLTLNGVGSGTNIDYVHIHNGSDDGLEFFGGTVSAKHVVLTGNDDDNIDWQTGWRGKVQHVLVLQKSVGERGIEADNNSSARDSNPRSKGNIANMTILGGATNGHGIKLRDGTAANLYNFVVKTAGSGCIDIDHGPTFLNGGSSATALTGELTIVNSLFDCTSPFSDAADDNWSTQAWFTGQTGNLTGSSGMTGYINSATVNARPAATLPNDGFFDQVDYIGAVKDAENDWTLGWTFREPFTTLVP